MSGFANELALFEFEAEKFGFLVEMGFKKTVDATSSGEIREVKYVSSKFIYTVGIHFGRDRNYSKFSRVNGDELPSPITVLEYFLPNYFEDRKSIESRTCDLDPIRKAISINAELCKSNSWIFTTDSWVDDESFLNAIAETNKWFWALGRPLSDRREYVEKLRSFRRNVD